jgi:hypothetical protein
MVKLGLLLGVGCVTAVAAAAPEGGPRYVSSRDILVSYQTANTAAIDRVHLWVSTDLGRSWQRTAGEMCERGRVRFEAPADGRYDFYVVLENAAGVSGPEPTSGTRAHSAVIVDTVPPLLQLHAVEVAAAPEGGRLLKMRISLIEEYLHERGMRLFHRTDAGQPWQDGGAAHVLGDVAEWVVPADSPGEFEVILMTADLAGNRVTSEPQSVMLPPVAVAASQPAVAEPQTVTGAKAEVPAATSPAATELTPALTRDEIRAIRETAARLRGEGRTPLALSRLEEAARAAPRDADLLIDLGTTLYSTRRYDDAAAQFERALTVAPDNRAAIEGLAVVAATQRRYPEARQRLAQLLTQTPESGLTWLRYGDVEHRLGNRDEALKAWRRVLEVDPADSDARSKAETRLRHFGSGGSDPATASSR